jgi:hypothetical protein
VLLAEPYESLLVGLLSDGRDWRAEPVPPAPLVPSNGAEPK